MLLFGGAGLYAITMHLADKYIDHEKVPIVPLLIIGLMSWVVSWVSGAIFYIAAIVQVAKWILTN